MSQFFEIECSEGRVVTIEITDAGDALFHDYDIETELAAQELGFAPDLCYKIWAFLQPLWNDDSSQRKTANELLLQIVDEEIFDPDLDLSRSDKRALFQSGLVDILVALGADPNASNDEPETALALATNYGFADAVRTLLAAGADPNAEDSLAVRWAAGGPAPDILQLIIDAGADVTALDNAALRKTADLGYPNEARILLEAGADVAALSHEALLSAALGGHLVTLDVLLQYTTDTQRVRQLVEQLRYDDTTNRRTQNQIFTLLNRWLEDHDAP